MRVLLDAGYPPWLTEVGRRDVSFELRRPETAGAGDVDLVAYAAEHGFDALAFVGPAAFARQHLIDAAEQRRIVLIATTSVDPFESAERLLAAAGPLARTRRAVVLVGAGRIAGPR